MLRLILMTAALLCAAAPAAAAEFSGTITDWTSGTARLFDFNNNDGTKIPLGTIAEDGSFTITPQDTPLADFDVTRSFTGCGLEITGGENMYYTALQGAIGVDDGTADRGLRGVIGRIGAASSKNVVAWQIDPFENNAEVGYSVGLVHVSGAASVNGECADDKFTTSWELNLEPGWNIVVIDYLETGDSDVFETKTVVKTHFRTVAEYPEDSGWYFFPRD